MKITKNRNYQQGMTLVEVTLVIAVLLSLVGALFVGVTAYSKGASRAKCILNIATAQKAARSHQNLYALKTGDPMVVGDLAGSGKLIENTPDCPEPTGSYTFRATVPAPSVAYIDCSLASSDQHVPASVSGW